MNILQRGGFVLGAIFGLLAGLAVALGVALYIAKVPVPFVNKVQHRTVEQDQAEIERNKNWDPNAPLAGKSAPPKAAAPAAPASDFPPPPVPPVAGASRPAQPKPAASSASAPARPARDPAAILAGIDGAASQPAVRKSTEPNAAALVYFVQAGAYGREEDAESQRARVAMLGVTARITEREQSGRTMYRVRVGPYTQKDEAERVRDQLQATGIDAALVHVQR